MPAERVAPPLVAECFANLECKVADTRLVNELQPFHSGSGQSLD
jgi:flavin reductase (DIM6/NTAB) family NADH-FMN oxidoreductase RutF